MEVKNNVTFEVKKEDRIYHLHVPVGANIGEIYSVLLEYVDKVVALINEYNEKLKAKPPEEEKKEE